jgi:hypothetical protein
MSHHGHTSTAGEKTHFPAHYRMYSSEVSLILIPAVAIVPRHCAGRALRRRDDDDGGPDNGRRADNARPFRGTQQMTRETQTPITVERVRNEGLHGFGTEMQICKFGSMHNCSPRS